MPVNIELREVAPADLPLFFENQRDPEAVWMAAFTAKDPNDRILYKTALRPTSGIVEVKGNLTDSAIFKRAGMTPEAVGHFDRKAFVVVFYLGEAEAQQDLFRGRALERLRGVVPAETLRGLARFNFGAEAAALQDGSDADLLDRAAKAKLLDTLRFHLQHQRVSKP